MVARRIISEFVLTVVIASRNGGARLEKQVLDGRVVIHNYGAGGAGYQCSWCVESLLSYFVH